MASTTRQPNGRTYVQHLLADGRRVKFSLGKVNKQQAGEFKGHVERLAVAVRTATAIPAATLEWLAALDERHHATLVRGDLCEARRPRTRSTDVASFARDYVAGRVDLRPGRRIVIGQTVRALGGFFGNRPLAHVTAADAVAFKRHLEASGLAMATVAKRVKDAKMMFTHAVDAEIIKRSPFDKVTAGRMSNRSRHHFVDRETIARVIDAAPNADWRLIIGLARYAGLRCPSELAGLTWDCVDFTLRTMRVRSPKTENQGKPFRSVPIDAALLPLLVDAWDLTPTGEAHVLRRPLRDGANINPQMRRIVERAGVVPWPKIFTNLRSSRETELLDWSPQHVVNDVMGHSRQVASEHYQQTRPEHLQAIADLHFGGSPRGAESGAAARGTPRHVAAGFASFQPEINENGHSPCVANGRRMTPTGFEPVSRQ